MIEDIIKSIKAHLYDRTASPLFGAFVISWLLWNHRFIMAIVFGNGLQEKYEMMDKAICNSLWYPHIWLQFIVFPLGTALFYIYAYPYPARLIYSYSKRQQEKLNSMKNEIENNRRLTEKESSNLIAQHTLIENEYQNTINRLNTGISALNSEIKSKEDIIKEQNERLIKYEKDTNSSTEGQTFLKPKSLLEITNEIDEENDDPESTNLILIHIGSNEGTTKDTIHRLLGNKDKIYIDLLLDRLKAKQLVNLVNNSYYITTKGREHLFKNRIIQ